MLPGNYEFEWDTGHVIFLGTFYLVLGIVMSTVSIALLRSWRRVRSERFEALRWHCDFEDLPQDARRCRHDLTGETPGRLCQKAFECRRCAEHFEIVASRDSIPLASDVERIAGFALPPDRLYHRGHTWVRREEDGTVTVGLDDLGAHLLGRPDRLILPPVGEHLSVHGEGWLARRASVRVRVMSPVDGVVVAHGGDEDDWILRIRPDEASSLAHLFDVAEVRPWMLKEVERLHGLLAETRTGTTLPDGGAPVDDFATAIPKERYDTVCGLIFLEP